MFVIDDIEAARLVRVENIFICMNLAADTVEEADGKGG